ncbi:hypothetical protein ZYGR_0H03760 [Zygosaccharomyces rouxii]|uniref:ZYRO0B12628p n=2 Tax=Zygosaccharomyces rouxii TaxID=4956 RepID=C5DRZ8_ZYGRC|nr:uncharacterized protein ZYRO0B12628g [Zygosaccharomyces rouxii]KAH9199912.1 hypothetical protein LQ764DRAFT_209718 [Zygosaccharomyces rouxii]GAV47531.1 hypothetical protein ZYGR_0H03760 [Zygosaccharomyces rouxii]CAR26559.1 ZYRO0B12628p [Zygosaccharomyces rouxii]
MLKPCQSFLQSLKTPIRCYLRSFSSTIHLRRIITLRTFEKVPDTVRPELLIRHKDENLERIASLSQILELDEYGIKIADESELTKCLYPTKYTRIELPNGISYSNHQLEILGRKLLYLQVYQAYLSLFKRSDSDICDYDFNYYSKMDNMSRAKRNPSSVIHRHLKHIKLSRLARLPIPNNQVPLRIQFSYDQKSFNAIIGYISMTHEDHIVNRFLNKVIAERLIKTVLLR